LGCRRQLELLSDVPQSSQSDPTQFYLLFGLGEQRLYFVARPVASTDTQVYQPERELLAAPARFKRKIFWNTILKGCRDW
jgi:hypothetical protein